MVITLTNGYTFYDFNEVESLYMSKFNSKGQCTAAGENIKNFMRNSKFNGSMQHSHDQNNLHNHKVNKMYALDLDYTCIKAKGF
mgnify:CR=1 FL=1